MVNCAKTALGVIERLGVDNQRWCETRDESHAAWHRSESPRLPVDKHYFRGTAPDGAVAAEHQTRLHLQPFTR